MPIHAHMLPAFAAIMMVIFAGMFSMSWWAAAVGASLLALVSLTSPAGSLALHGRSGAIGFPTLMFSTALNASAAAAASFTLGRAIGWVWGL